MASGAPPANDPDRRWASFRERMPVAGKWAYLDHAAVSPIPAPTREAILRWADQAAREGDVAWAGWSGQVEELRGRVARLTGAEREEIALVANTTTGISLVAEGFPWREGDNVVTLADEFPSNQYPWMNLARRGVATRRVATERGRVDVDRLIEAMDERTRVLAVSWVSFSSGWRNDLDQLAEIAHRRGAMLFVDAIQGLGALELDVRRTPVDFFAADGHKWLLGPEGAGVLFIRRQHLDRLRPLGVGWKSVVHDHDFSRIELVLKDSASRYEGGSQNMAGLIGLGRSVALLEEFGIRAVQERVLAITDLACRRLEEVGAVLYSDRSPEHKSGIVVFELPGRDVSALRRRCLGQGVVLSCRGGRLRISPHAYNDPDDIERCLQALP